MFKKFLMGLVCLSLVAMVGCGGGGGGSSHTPTQDIKEAIKGKWYLQSEINGDYTSPYFTSDDGKASYIEINDDKTFKNVEYSRDDNNVFIGNPTETSGTWVYDNSNLYVTWPDYENQVTTYTVSLKNEILSLSQEGGGKNERASAITITRNYKKTKPAKYTAPAISEEALKGKWYSYSIIEGDNPEAYYYSSNDGKATYIEIKDNKKFESVSYNCESEVNRVFTGDPTNEEGTWRLEDNLLILTTNQDMGYTVISVDDEILTLRLQFNNGFIEILKLKKTPPAKLE